MRNLKINLRIQLAKGKSIDYIYKYIYKYSIVTFTNICNNRYYNEKCNYNFNLSSVFLFTFPIIKPFSICKCNK